MSERKRYRRKSGAESPPYGWTWNRGFPLLQVGCHTQDDLSGLPEPVRLFMNWRDQIVTDPNLCHGQAYIRGIRIPISIVLDNLAAGLSHEEILESYPSLTKEAIQAATRYAAELARERIVDLSRRRTA